MDKSLEELREWYIKHKCTGTECDVIIGTNEEAVSCSICKCKFCEECEQENGNSENKILLYFIVDEDYYCSKCTSIPYCVNHGKEYNLLGTVFKRCNNCKSLLCYCDSQGEYCGNVYDVCDTCKYS